MGLSADDPSRANPKLAPLSAFVGTWNTVGGHPLLPGVPVQGRTRFSWIEGGAFLCMNSEMDDPRIPNGVGIFGTDDASGECFLLYFDERGVSRKYDVQLRDDGMTWSRNDPAFSQRMELTVSADGNVISSRGAFSRDGGAWQGDLELTYRRNA